MKLVGAMHAATVMAARKAATVVHKVVRKQRAKQSNATKSLRRKCAKKESLVSRGELSLKQLATCWHTYCYYLL